MSRRHYTRCGRPPFEIFPPDVPLVPDMNQGEVRLAMEVWDALDRGYIMPLPVLHKAHAIRGKLKG